MKDTPLQNVRRLVGALTADIMGKKVQFRVERDVKRPVDGRIFVQCAYRSRCTVSGVVKTWHGRKWYLSDYMTDDEVVKTCFAAFKATVEHEIMEGFHYQGRRVFNPHASFIALMEAGEKEVYRAPQR